MKILIVCATEMEMEELRSIRSEKHDLEVLVAGVGMVSTTYLLTKILQKNTYDLVINVGLAGSFNRSIAIGEVVYVHQDTFSELGAEDDKKFLSLKEIGLNGTDRLQSKPEEKYPSLNKFKKVNSITVNTVHGNDDSIASVVELFNPDIETMEGAAFFYVCEKEHTDAIQLRAISNYVEKRNRDAWNVPLALRSLYEALKGIINEL